MVNICEEICPPGYKMLSRNIPSTSLNCLKKPRLKSVTKLIEMAIGWDMVAYKRLVTYSNIQRCIPQKHEWWLKHDTSPTELNWIHTPSLDGIFWLLFRRIWWFSMSHFIRFLRKIFDYFDYSKTRWWIHQTLESVSDLHNLRPF